MGNPYVVGFPILCFLPLSKSNALSVGVITSATKKNLLYKFSMYQLLGKSFKALPWIFTTEMMQLIIVKLYRA